MFWLEPKERYCCTYIPFGLLIYLSIIFIDYLVIYSLIPIHYLLSQIFPNKHTGLIYSCPWNSGA